MKKLFTIIALLFLISSNAQTWEKIHSTTYTMSPLGCQENEFNSVTGGLYLGMANYTPPFARIIRFDALGDTLWTKPVALDSIGYQYYVTSTAQKLNGNYLLGGYAATPTVPITRSFFIEELTPGGNYVKRDQFVVNTNQYGIDLEAAKSNNDYYIVYKADSIIGSNSMRFNTLLKRVTPSGAIAWQQSYIAYGTFSSYNGAWVGGIHSTLDDGLIYFKGESGITSFEKRNPVGVLTWSVDIANLLGVPSNSLYIDAHATLKDSGFVFSCEVGGGPNFFSYLVKLDKNGGLVDTLRYNKTGLMSLAEASTGKILACYMTIIGSNIHSGLLVIDKTLSVNNFYPSPFTYNTNNFGKICPNNMGGGMISIQLSPSMIGGPGYVYLVNFDSLINTYPFKFKGTWAIDRNKDCNLGAGDKVNSYQLLKIKEASSPGDKYCLTNNVGDYSTSLPNGTCTVTHVPRNYRNYECPSIGGYTFNVIGAGLSTGNNLLDTLVPGINEVGNTIFCSGFVPGINSHVSIFYSNNGSTIVNSKIKILKDTSLIYINSLPVVNSISGDTLIYNVSNFDIDSVGYIGLTVRTKTYIPIGTKIRMTTNFILSNDTLPSNNLDSLNTNVISSFDPNKKEVSEPLCMNINNDLVYRVRFQNTGTAPANNILVVDTLDSNLDLTTYKLLYKSHPNLDIKWRSNNRMEYRFDNINLPDSTSNEPLSHGEFVYSIKVNPSIPFNTKVRNRAWIYFDYNLPVITNVTENMVCALTTDLSQSNGRRQGLTIFPNPASQYVNLKYAGFVKKIELYDLTGQLIQSILIDNQQAEYSIGIPILEEGLYFIKLYGIDEVYTNKLVIMH